MRTVTLMTMQPISDDMVTTSKICVVVTKAEWALSDAVGTANVSLKHAIHRDVHCLNLLLIYTGNVIVIVLSRKE